MLRPQKYKRFFPVYFLKMASDLKKGKKRQEIVRELSEKHGVPALTAEAYLSKHFPVSKLRKGVSIDSLLWQAREKMLSAEDRSRIGRKGWEGKSPEERSRIVRKGWEGKSPEERSRIGRERWTKLSPEERSRIGRKGWEGKSPEERSRIGRKGWEGKSPEERSRIGRKGWEGKSPEERSRIGRKAWEGKSPEERSRIARERWANVSPEERSRIVRKAWEGKSPEERSRIGRKGWEGKSPEERSRIARERWTKLSAEERSRIGRKAWEAKTEKSQVAKRSRTRETLKNIVDRKKGFAPDEHNLLIVLQQIFSEKEINKIKPSIQNLRPEEFLPIFEAIYDSELLYRQQITFENFIFFRENLMKKARLSKPRTEQALIVINNTLQRRLSS